MELLDFVHKYRSCIDVIFDYEKFQNDTSSRVSCQVLDRDEIGRLSLPWYLDRNGISCSYNTSGARHVSVKEIAENLDLLPEHTQKIKDQMNRLSMNSDFIYQPGLPVVASSREEKVLIDGCHRVVAAFVLNNFQEIESIEIFCLNMKNICKDFIL